jgi:G3E family GTPase
MKTQDSRQSLIAVGWRAPRNHENARSALECGSEAAALESQRKGGSKRYRTPRCLRHNDFQSRVNAFLKERSWNVVENKGSLWKTRERSWNVYENTGT